jgi:2-hydroxychromene-2-carboxylate isomerase
MSHAAQTGALDSGAPGPGAGAPVEIWFEFGSNYSYLSVMRIEAAAAAQGLSVCWRPFLLGPIFRALGWHTSPFVLQKEKGAYVWRDMERQCAKYGLPWRKPSVFPRAATLPMKVAAANGEAPWIGAYCRSFMMKNFVLDQDIDSVEQVCAVLTEIGADAPGVLDRLQQADQQGRLRAATDEARRRGIFGAPTFFVRDEMFWGNDRLDDALAAARR